MPKDLAEDYFDRIKKDKEAMKRYQRERTILMVGELITKSIDKNKKMNREDVEKKLGREEGYIKEILNGEYDPTIKELQDIFTVLGESLLSTSCPTTIGFEEFSKIQDIFGEKKEGNKDEKADTKG